jgi:hypothetical protein
MAPKNPSSKRLRLLTLVGMLVLSGACFYGAHDAISTGATKSPGRNNSHIVTLASEPKLFHSLVKFDLAAGVLFGILGLGSYFFGAANSAPGRDGNEEL